jgi:hypothetical protein
MVNYQKFEGRLPYATELYAYIQSLLGFLGKLMQNRVAVEYVILLDM